MSRQCQFIVRLENLPAGNIRSNSVRAADVWGVQVRLCALTPMTKSEATGNSPCVGMFGVAERWEGKREHAIGCQAAHLSEGVIGLPSKAGGRPVRKDDGSKSDPRHHAPEEAMIFRHLPQSSDGIS